MMWRENMPGLNKRTLGKTGIQTTEIGIGLWAMGGEGWGETDDRDSLDSIDEAVEMGVNFFDTADAYGRGHSEELLGRAMKGRRDKFIVSTKIGWLDYNGEKNQTAYDTLDKFIRGVESSLRRLQTDYIDVIFRHIFYKEPTHDIFLEGFQRLQKDGKIKGYGISSSDFDYIKEFNSDGQCSVLQIDYSILNRTAEEEIFPYCRKNNIGVVIRGALAMGTLTGKFNTGTQFKGDDFRRNWQNKPDEKKIFLEDLAKVEKLKPLAEGRTLAELALQFTLANPAVSVVIPGAKNPKQVRDNAAAGILSPLPDKVLKEIDRITPPGGGRKIWPA
jgi:aryl-alcohol dehydrogenase-like predicted oxidoreductase